MRCDVNVSVRPEGQQQFGTKVEIKNMNSFSAMQRAIDFEIARQTQALRAGGSVDQETRLFDENKQVRLHAMLAFEHALTRPAEFCLWHAGYALSW